MKRLVLLALAVVSTFALLAPAKAQEFAPLVQKDTVSLIRVNLDKLDADNLSAQAEKLANSAIDYFVDDSEQAGELKQVVPLGKVFIAQYFGSFVQPLKDAGVSNVYFVIEQSDDSEETLYPYVGIPTESLSKDQLQQARDAMKAINQQVDSALKYRFVRNGVFYTLIVPSDADDDEIKAYVKERFTKISPVEKPEFIEGFKLADPDAIVSGVSVAAKNEGLASSQLETVFAQLDEVDELEGEIADKIKGYLKDLSDLNLKCADLVKFNVWDVNADDLKIVSRTVVNSEDAAKEYVKLIHDDLGGSINEIIDFAFEKALEKADDQDLSKEEADGIASALKDVIGLFLKYDVDGATVSWKMDGAFWSDNKPVLENFASKVSTLAEKFKSDDDEDDNADDEEDGELDF